MTFVDRRAELERLRRASREGGLVVVWGRRRVGKSRLLVEWLRKGRGVYWVADASAAPVQRAYLAEALGARLPGFAEARYPDWGALLARLGRDAAAGGWRGPLVLDELPYLVESAPELPSVLQRFVDHDLAKSGLTLAFAGSSQRMMQGLVLGAEAPLYGRAREILKVAPLAAPYLREALGIRRGEDVVDAYAAWGGVPRYWELAAPFRGVREAVAALVLDPLGPLHEEPARLLLEEVPSAVALRPILDAIGAGAHRVSEIAGRLGQPATSLARPLARLQELGLVTRETPFGEPPRSGKRALYKLADPFLRLWFAMAAPRRGWLAQAAPADRRALFDRAFPRLRSLAWEDLCRQAVPRLRIGGRRFSVPQRYWRGEGPEWDVVAESVDGSTLLLGEVAWVESESALPRRLEGMRLRGVPALAGRPARVQHALFIPRRPRRPAEVPVLDVENVLSALG